MSLFFGKGYHMSKISALLKKVELFEKLAIYGNRKTLLESFAQDAISDSGDLFRKALQLANNARQEVINSWLSLPNDAKSMGYYQEIRSMQPKNTNELASMANSLNKIAKDLLGRRDDSAAITAGIAINRAMGDLMSHVAQLKQYQLDLTPKEDAVSEIGSPAPTSTQPVQPPKATQVVYGGKVGAAAASIANTLKTLIALPDAQKATYQKQIDDAKKRLVPYLEKTLMPYLPGDAQDEYNGIINSFNTKYNLLIQKSPY